MRTASGISRRANISRSTPVFSGMRLVGDHHANPSALGRDDVSRLIHALGGEDVKVFGASFGEIFEGLSFVIHKQGFVRFVVKHLRHVW